MSISNLHWHSSGPFCVSSIACYIVKVLFDSITQELLQKLVKVFWLVRLLIKLTVLDQTLYPLYLFPPLCKLFHMGTKEASVCKYIFCLGFFVDFFLGNLVQYSFIPLPGYRPLGSYALTGFIQIWRRAWRSGNCLGFLLYMFLAILPICYFCTEEYIARLSSGFPHLTVSRRRV